MDREVLAKAAVEKTPFALVTILEVRGSAPRHPGSSMLVRADGSIAGTVGGGTGESKAVAAGLAAIAAGRSSLLEVEMLSPDPLGKGLICGGLNRMLVEYVPDAAPYGEAARILGAGRKVLMRRGLGRLSSGELELEALEEDSERLRAEPGAPEASSGEDGRAAEALLRGEAVLLEEKIFLDPVLPEEKLLILGGGHVGKALAAAAAGLGFRITVADDRPAFADPARFGPGVEVRLGGYESEIGTFPFDPATYAVILSRGHLFDLECARSALKRDYRYLGLIGSKRKVALIKEQLGKDGYSPEKIASLRAPIGLDIGAETPEEIAISILAEMIAVRRKGGR